VQEADRQAQPEQRLVDALAKVASVLGVSQDIGLGYKLPWSGHTFAKSQTVMGFDRGVISRFISVELA
jgi:hypothetical protein